MNTNKLIIILIFCFISVLFSGAQHEGKPHTVTINDTKFKVQLDQAMVGTISGSKRFVTCENTAGVGFFWVDTSCGAVWWANPANNNWVYYGAPSPHRGQKTGRFIPCKNKDGAGLFILDTERGEGWWTNGREWKKMGLPQRKPKR